MCAVGETSYHADLDISNVGGILWDSFGVGDLHYLCRVRDIKTEHKAMELLV